MFAATRVPVPVGVVAWPGEPATTVVIKRTYELVGRGAGAPSPDQEPIRLDRWDPGGRLLVPSDLAPTKASCDVALVGEALLDPRGPVRLAVGSMRTQAPSAAELGPCASAGPSDRQACGDWTRASFDFERFQWAPRDRRLPSPQLPLEVSVAVGANLVATCIEGPPPDALVVDERGWATPRSVALRIDGVAIDLARHRVHVVWRGVVALAGVGAPLLAVDVEGAVARHPLRDVARWPRSEAIDAAVLRRVEALAQGMVARVKGGTVRLEDRTTRRSRGDLDTFGDDGLDGATTTGIIVPTFGSPPAPPTLGAPAPDPPHSPDDPDTLTDTVAMLSPAHGRWPRAEGASPSLAADPAWGTPPRSPRETLLVTDEATHDPLVGTVAVTTGSRTVLPFVPSSAPVPPIVAGPNVRLAVPATERTGTVELDVTGLEAAWEAELRAGAAPPVPAVVALPAAIAPVPSPAAVAPAADEASEDASGGVALADELDVLLRDELGGLTPARFAAIKAELWGGATSRREALARHGLTEAAWSGAERRLAARLRSAARR